MTLVLIDFPQHIWRLLLWHICTSRFWIEILHFSWTIMIHILTRIDIHLYGNKNCCKRALYDNHYNLVQYPKNAKISKNFNRLVASKEALRKTSKFYLISWCENFLETYSLRRVFGIHPKLCGNCAFLQHFLIKKSGEISECSECSDVDVELPLKYFCKMFFEESLNPLYFLCCD